MFRCNSESKALDKLSKAVKNITTINIRRIDSLKYTNGIVLTFSFRIQTEAARVNSYSQSEM